MILNDTDWTAATGTGSMGEGGLTTLSIPGGLAAGASTVVQITLDRVLDPTMTCSAGDDPFTNYSWIESFVNEGAPLEDQDSDPGSNTANENNVDPLDAGDNDVNSSGDGDIGSQ